MQGVLRKNANILQCMIDCGHVTKGISAWDETHHALQLACGVTNKGVVYITHPCVIWSRRLEHSFRSFVFLNLTIILYNFFLSLMYEILSSFIVFTFIEYCSY